MPYALERPQPRPGFSGFRRRLGMLGGFGLELVTDFVGIHKSDCRIHLRHTAEQRSAA